MSILHRDENASVHFYKVSVQRSETKLEEHALRSDGIEILVVVDL